VKGVMRLSSLEVSLVKQKNAGGVMQLISSYKVVFYDMDGNKVDIDLPEWAFESLDEGIAKWENDNADDSL
tara:strand:- start:770 stop:982 length:213 start_codon:yes stop_codon:yes gene_type:complete